MEKLSSDRGNTEELEYAKLNLDAMRKQNKLLDLEIEMREVELKMKKVELKQLGGVEQFQDLKKT